MTKLLAAEAAENFKLPVAHMVGFLILYLAVVLFAVQLAVYVKDIDYNPDSGSLHPNIYPPELDLPVDF